MKKGFVIILILISNLNHLKCADNYELGDILYVWAKSGLNVRVSPWTDSNVIAKLPFGESVLVLGKTDKTYNVMGIDTINIYRVPNLKVEPIIFNGNWVQIQTLDGQVGYVIDQYLLRYKVQSVDGNFASGLNLKIISIDTIFRKSILPNGEAMNSKTKVKYEGGITELVELHKYSFESECSFLNATIEEVLVLLSSHLNNFSGMYPLKNWKEEIALSAGACSYTIRQHGKMVILNYGCSC